MPAFVTALIYEVSYWATFFIWMIGFRLRVYGREHVPRRGPVLIIANHESMLDPIGVGQGVPRLIYFLTRKTLFRNPVFGAWLRAVRAVPIDQEGVGKEGIRTILACLADGRPVLVFPEGQRSFDGRMQPLRPGIALLVGRTRAVILPAGIAGAFEAWPRTRKWPIPSPLFLPRTNRALTVVYGPPRDPATLDGLSREEMLEVLQADIAAAREEAHKRAARSLASGRNG